MSIYDALMADKTITNDEKIEVFSKRIAELSIIISNSQKNSTMQRLMESTLDLNIHLLKRFVQERDNNMVRQAYMF